MVSKFKLDTIKTGDTKEAISRTLSLANSYAGELSIEVLSLDKVEVDPENNRELALTLHDAMNGLNDDDPDIVRKKREWKSLESLAKTIRDDQLINPIFVYRYGNKCRLIAGERRTLASAIAGKKEIIARIASQRPVGTKLRVLQWIENNERVDLSLAERIASIEAIINEYLNENKESGKEKITSKILSELTGMSDTQSRRYLIILQADPQIQKAIAEGKLENIKLVELIISVDNQEHQQLILNAALSGLTFDELIKLKNEVTAGYGRAPRKGTRGRKRENVSLGKVKPGVAKIIFEALITSKTMKKSIIEKMSVISQKVHWDNSESVQTFFKDIVSIIAQEA